MEPLPGDVHVNRPLTNISVAYIQDQRHFVSSQVFRILPVLKRSDRYFTYDRGDFNRDEAKKRAPSTESAGGGYSVDSTPNYFCDVYGFHKDVDDQTRGNADDPLNMDRDATIFVTQKNLIRREKSWVGEFFAGGVWTNDFDGVSGTPGTSEVYQWSDYTNGDPISDVDDAMEAVLESTGFEPNTMVVGYPVFKKLKNHPDIIDRVKYVQNIGANETVKINEQSLADLFGVNRFLVMKSIENTAAEGDTDSHSFIGGKKALLCYVTPTPGILVPTAGYTFSWTGYLGASEDGMRIKRFRMENLESDRIEGQMAFDQKLVSADLGYFWDSIVS